MTAADNEQYVLSHTTPRPVPLVPEVTLRSAEDVIGLWEDTARDAPPFWAFPWAGGQALARHVLDHPHLVAGRRVLDLAAGSGLVAIAAALAGAHAVTANDIDPYSAAAITVNARANGVTVRIVLEDLLDAEIPDTDVVLAGDVFYDRAMAARVLPFLRTLSDNGVAVLVGDPQRAHLPHDQFTALAIYDVPVPEVLESAKVKRTTIWSTSTVDLFTG